MSGSDSVDLRRGRTKNKDERDIFCGLFSGLIDIENASSLSGQDGFDSSKKSLMRSSVCI